MRAALDGIVWAGPRHSDKRTGLAGLACLLRWTRLSALPAGVDDSSVWQTPRLGTVRSSYISIWTMKRKEKRYGASPNTLSVPVTSLHKSTLPWSFATLIHLLSWWKRIRNSLSCRKQPRISTGVTVKTGTHYTLPVFTGREHGCHFGHPWIRLYTARYTGRVGNPWYCRRPASRK